MIEKKMNLSIDEISKQLGVTESSLLTFLGQSGYTQSYKVNEEKTVLSILEEYEDHLHKLVQSGKRTIHTEKTYKNFISRLREFLLNNYPLLKANEFNEIILNEALTYTNNNKYSVRTLNKYNAIIRSILKFAYFMEYTNKDSRNKFILEKTSLIPRYIKLKDIRSVLEISESLYRPYRCRAIIMFLLLTGCRVSEVSNIKVKDFDIENNLIYILDGKGNKDRIIPMFTELKEEILLYLNKSGLPQWNSYNDGFLFARDEGAERNRKIPIRTIQHLIKRIKDRIPELSFITVHSFRHTFAVHCLKAGIDPHYLTEVLGHEDPKTTKIYTKLDGEDLKEQIKDKFPYPLEILLNTLIEEKNEIDNGRN
ncbi:tyrosine-type recombinase/integrase [Cytobacillus pseudoceanisediminis]|uniref:Tyrosine-type recombinase/integrase n=1 Tax=Cytobacillus pseudoceanisediminis TaxID=3051614 RepID=A0ABZ2ZMW6_9BACI